MYGGDEVNALVLDIGSYQMKAGYAGEDTPKHVFSSLVGSLPSEDASSMQVESSSGARASGGRRRVAGAAVQARPRDGLELSSPYEGPLLSDWDGVEALLDQTFARELRADVREHPVLLAEPSQNSKEARERVVELLFERFDAPAAFLGKNAALSAFSTGRQTALIVSADHAYSTVAAVHDGYVLQRSVVTTPCAGRLLNRCMLQTLKSKAEVRPRYAFHRVEDASAPHGWRAVPGGRPTLLPDGTSRAPIATASFEAFALEQIAQDAKESVCRVSDGPFDPAANEDIPTVSYELPDGQEVHIGADRFALPEILLDPDAILGRYGGVEALLADDPLFGPGYAGAGGGAAADGAAAKDKDDAAEGKQGAKDTDDAPASAETPLKPLSLQAAAAAAVSRCDVDVRRELLAGAVLVGGTALFPALRDRVERALSAAAPASARVRLVSPANSIERRYSVWIGGSILASLGSFQQMWLSKEEYQEHGAALIHKKSP